MRQYRYGVTPAQFEQLLEEQDNRCAVCLIEFGEDVKPNVDHNHRCCPGSRACKKCLRGLLCFDCLDTAARFETRFKYMDDMLKYLTKYLIGGEK